MAEPLHIAVDNTKPKAKPAGITVRRGGDDDRLAIYRMLTEIEYPENGIGSLSEMKAAHEIDRVFLRGYVFIAERRGQIAGTVGLIMGEPFWYSQDRALYERWLFVHPAHRASMTARVLLETMQRFSEDSGLPLVTATFTPRDPDRKGHLFRRSGLIPAGEIFVKGFARCASMVSSVAAVAAEAKPKP